MNAYKNVFKPMMTLSFCFLVACAPIRAPGEMPMMPKKPLMKQESIEPAQQSSMQAEEAQKSQISQEKMIQPSKAPHGAGAQSLTSWHLSGAIAARNKNKSWTASLNWAQQGPNRYLIRLSGPLGGGTVIVEKQDGVVMFRDGAKKVTSASADKLLLDQTGVYLPVSSLYYWVRGIPAPGPHQETRGPGQLISQLHQGGYTITYSQYTVVNGMALPTKIRLEGHGVMIKLAIRSWGG